jgi:hypothetical protein
MSPDLEKCRKQVEASIATLKNQLEPLESGMMMIGLLSADEPQWKDLTKEEIEQNRRAIRAYEGLLDAIDKRLRA